MSWCYVSDGGVLKFSTVRNRLRSQNILLLRVRLILADFSRIWHTYIKYFWRLHNPVALSFYF